jgi:hypothetical protein
VSTRGAFVAPMCSVVRLFSLQGVYSFESLRHPWISVRLAHYVQT